MSYSDDRLILARNLRKMEDDGKRTLRSMLALRKTAYKSAVVVNRILHESMNELVAELQTAYKGVKNPVDQWLVDQFKPYALAGGDYHEALRAVENRVPLKRYLALDFTFTVRQAGRIKKGKEGSPSPIPDTQPIPDPPAPTTPVIEQVVAWEKRSTFLDTRLTAVSADLTAARARIRELEQENATLKARLRTLEAALEAA